MRIIKFFFLMFVLCSAFFFGRYATTAVAQSLANPVGAVGPVLAFFDRGNQEDINSNVLDANGYIGAVEVINSIFDNPAYNPSPGQNVTLRIVDIRPTTTTQQMEDYANRLAACNCFPSGTIVTVGNELNNLTAEFPIPGASPNNSASLRSAAQQYGALYIAFARALKNAPGGSNFRVAPAPPDLYNGDWNPVPWVEGFRSYVNPDGIGVCAVTDTLVANVYDIPSRVGFQNLESYKYLEGRICGLTVTRLNEWGPSPTLSVADHVEFLNNTPLPDGISEATTLIPDNCDGNDGRATSSWLFYIDGRVFQADGTEVDPETCATTTSPDLGQPYDVEPYTPCNETRNPEFHSLRPYPASPCDQTPEITAALCADDLVARFQYEFQRGEGLCTTNGDGVQTCTYEVQTQTNLTLGVGTAELPIAGNTEDVPNSTTNVNSIDFATRMNEYVSWYLNGVTSRAEEEDELVGNSTILFPITEAIKTARLNEVINLSGPIKKLLPFDIQNSDDSGEVVGLRQQQVNNINTIRHNQIVVCAATSLSRFPVACYRGQDGARFRLDQIPRESIFIGGAAGNDLLVHNPFYSYLPFSSTEDRVGALMMNSRGYSFGGTEDGGQGVVPDSIIFDPNEEQLRSAEGLLNPYRELYFAHMQEIDELGDILQRTFVPREVSPGEVTDRAPIAPAPGVAAQSASNFCTPLQEPITNPGDQLYGNLQRNNAEPVQGTLSFTANFTCNYPPPVLNQSCWDECVAATGDPFGATCGYCYDTVDECTREVFIPMIVQTTVPLADDVWSRFVMGGMSIFRRIFPRIERDAPIERIEDIPAWSRISYSSSATSGSDNLIESGAIAGNPFAGENSAGRMYFPHLGSVHEYFLNGIQCALRPYEIGCPETNTEIGPGEPPPIFPLPETAEGSLAAAARPLGMYMGTAVTWAPFSSNNTLYMQTLAREYNYVVSENEFKPRVISRSETRTDFTNTDQFVNWAQANNRQLGAHTLVWHNSVPRWLEEGNYSNAFVENWLEKYIKQIVGRYRGKVAIWDVVNEPISFSSPYTSASLRRSFWYNKVGSDYMDKAFRWAKEADPSARLFINEYSTEWNNPKTEVLRSTVQGFLSRGVPIDGVGFQAHVRVGTAPSYEQIYESMKKFTDMGLQVAITELDVAIPLPVTTAKLNEQAEIYRRVTRACVALAPRCIGITTWGFTDRYTWIGSGSTAGGSSGSSYGAPLPFDKNYAKKPAYYAILDELQP